MNQTHPAASPRLAIATSAAYPDLNSEDQQLRQCLQAHGVITEVQVWNDPAVDWRQFDAVLIRSIWDYFERYAEYLAWLAHLRDIGLRTINPLKLLRWNSDKSYLLEFAAAGVAIAPTTQVAGTQMAAHCAALSAGQWVVKPTVSGGAWHTLKGSASDAQFLDAVAQLPSTLDYLVQPYLPQISSAGEWSLLFFAGQFSHAVLKTPRTDDYRVQTQFGGQTLALAPPPGVLANAQHILETCCRLQAIDASDLSYARVDGVVVDDRFLLMELELIEPFLFLEHHPQAVQRCTRAVLDALAVQKD